MKNFGSRQIAALGLATFAALFAVVGFGDLGFWDEVNGPGPGFFPAIMAVLMLVMSIVAFLQSFRETGAIEYTRDELLVVGCGIALTALACLCALRTLVDEDPREGVVEEYDHRARDLHGNRVWCLPGVARGGFPARCL